MDDADMVFAIGGDSLIEEMIAHYAIDCGLIPYWHACLKGPYNPFTGEDVTVTLDGIICETSEEAEEKIWDCILEMCYHTGLPFDPDDWTLKHIIPRGAN